MPVASGRSPAVVAFSAQDPSTLIWLDVGRRTICKRGLDDASRQVLHREVDLLMAARAVPGLAVPAGAKTAEGSELGYARGLTLGRELWGSRRRRRAVLWNRALAAAAALDAGVAGPTHPDFTVENLVVGRRGTLTLIDWKEELAATAEHPVAVASLLASAVAYRSAAVESRWAALCDLGPQLELLCTPELAKAIGRPDLVELRGVPTVVRERLAELVAGVSSSGR